MEYVALILAAAGTLISQIGIIESLFVAITLTGIYILIKYVPVLIASHFTQIGIMQDKFSANLDVISTKFVWSLDRISKEHDAHLSKLNEMHLDIKDLRNVKNN